MIESQYITDVMLQFKRMKLNAEKGMLQVSDDAFLKLLHDDGNSIGLIVKHVAGNLRSRWTDFLTSDGEKSDRNRDREFELDAENTRSDLMARWDKGWAVLFDVIGSLTPDDLQKTVYIRAEPHSVVMAINRQLTHYSEHVGQIVMLSKYWAGDTWETLSIAKGASVAFNQEKMSKRSESE